MRSIANRIVPSLLASLAAISCGLGCASDKKTLAQANTFDSGLKPAEVGDPVINDYLQQIGYRILDSAKLADAEHFGPKTHFKRGEDGTWMFDSQRIRFHLVNSKTLNAFTTGGEHVYVYYALFKECQNENDLAAVMSHEFGHIYCRHVQKGMNRDLAVKLGAGAAGAAGYLAGGEGYAKTGSGLAASAGQYLNMGFTRGDEAQADEAGFYFYTHAGWDPVLFSEFFKVMIAQGYDKTPASQSDHPTLASRVKAADERVAALSPAAANWRKPSIKAQVEFDEIRARARDVAARTPSDAQLQNARTLLQALPRSCWTSAEPDDMKQAQQQLQLQQAQSK